MPSAFYLDDNSPLSEKELNSIGVECFILDADNYEKEGKLAELCKTRGYTYTDFVHSEKIPNLKDKLAIFFEEHLHDDDEIRFFVDGSGFFDVRDQRSTKDRYNSTGSIDY